MAADLLHDERAVEALALLRELSRPTADPHAGRHWLLAKALALHQLLSPVIDSEWNVRIDGSVT
jgi:hypothetical protein